MLDTDRYVLKMGWNKEKNLFRIPQGSMILPTKAPEHRTDLQFFSTLLFL